MLLEIRKKYLLWQFIFACLLLPAALPLRAETQKAPVDSPLLIKHYNNLPAIKGIYNNSMREGLWQSWYASGKLRYLVHYKEGIPEGELRYYYENGKILFEGKYLHGAREGTWIFYQASGLNEREQKYLHGRPIGIWKHYSKKGVCDTSFRADSLAYKYESLNLKTFNTFFKDYLFRDSFLTTNNTLYVSEWHFNPWREEREECEKQNKKLHGMYYCFTYACHDPYQAMQNYLTIQDGHYINGKKEKEWISTSRLYTFSPYDSSLAYTYLEWYSTEFRNDMKKGASAIYKSRDGKMYEEHYTFKNDTLEGPSSTKYPGREEKGEYKKNIPVGKWISIDSTNKYNSSSGISLNEATDIIHDTDVLNTIGDSLIQKIFLLKTENKLHNFVAGKTYEMTGQLSHVELRADTFYADLSVLTYPYRDTVFEDPEHYIYAIGGRGELMRSLFRNGFYTTQVSGSGFSNMKSYFRNKQLYISRIDSLEKSRTAISHFDVYYPSGKKYCTGHIILMNERYSELPFSSGRFPEFPKQKIDTLPYFHGGFNLNNNCFKDGFWIYWNEDGSLKKKMYYNAGMLQSVSTK